MTLPVFGSFAEFVESAYCRPIGCAQPLRFFAMPPRSVRFQHGPNPEHALIANVDTVSPRASLLTDWLARIHEYERSPEHDR